MHFCGRMSLTALRLTPLNGYLKPVAVDLRDESAQHAGHAGAASGGGHWQLTIVSEAFRGKNAVARHRMIYEALGDLMKRDIHALKIEAFAPEQS